MENKGEEKKFDYKKPEELRAYIDDRGRIKTRRETGLASGEQHNLEKAIKRARHLILLPKDSESVAIGRE